MKTLITGGKSAQALKLLKAFNGQQVLLADYGELPTITSSQYHFISLGERNDDIIAHNLLNSCLDHSVERLLPLYSFELEAVVKSAVLFEEFNISVLLPDISTFHLYPLQGALNTQCWAVYEDGELIFAAPGNHKLPQCVSGLNGVFYLDESVEGFNPILFTI